MNMSADEKLNIWLCDPNDGSVGTQEHILDNWENNVTAVSQDDINPGDIKKSRIEEVQAEIAGDGDSPETEIIIDDKQANKFNSTKPMYNLGHLLIKISVCESIDDLALLGYKSIRWPEDLKGLARTMFDDKMNQLEKTAKKDPDDLAAKDDSNV